MKSKGELKTFETSRSSARKKNIGNNIIDNLKLNSFCRICKKNIKIENNRIICDSKTKQRFENIQTKITITWICLYLKLVQVSNV